MSLAREIKDLAIALEALTRVPKSDSAMDQVDMIMCEKIDQLRKETKARTEEEENREIYERNAKRQAGNERKDREDEIPF